MSGPSRDAKPDRPAVDKMERAGLDRPTFLMPTADRDPHVRPLDILLCALRAAPVPLPALGAERIGRRPRAFNRMEWRLGLY